MRRMILLACAAALAGACAVRAGAAGLPDGPAQFGQLPPPDAMPADGAQTPADDASAPDGAADDSAPADGARAPDAPPAVDSAPDAPSGADAPETAPPDCASGSGWRVCGGACIRETYAANDCGGCGAVCPTRTVCSPTRHGAGCCWDAPGALTDAACVASVPGARYLYLAAPQRCCALY